MPKKADSPNNFRFNISEIKIQQDKNKKIPAGVTTPVV